MSVGSINIYIEKLVLDEIPEIEIEIIIKNIKTELQRILKSGKIDTDTQQINKTSADIGKSIAGIIARLFSAENR